MKAKNLMLAGLLGVAATQTMAAERIAVGTGGAGGVFYAVGAGVADVINHELPGVSATAEVTGASIENIRRVSAGQMQIGFSSASTIYDAEHAKEVFDEPQNVAAIAYLYPAALQLAVTEESGIDSIEDLKDARVSLGPPGGNSSVIAQRLLEAYDAFNPSNIEFLSYSEATSAIKDNQLDATFVLAGVPASALISLSTSEDIKFLSVDEDKLQGLLKEYPFYSEASIPARTYGQKDDVVALGDPVILFTSQDADEDLIYSVTKTLFENLKRWHTVHPMARMIQPETAPNTPIDLHPGAARYYSEIGVGHE